MQNLRRLHLLPQKAIYPHDFPWDKATLPGIPKAGTGRASLEPKSKLNVDNLLACHRLPGGFSVELKHNYPQGWQG